MNEEQNPQGSTRSDNRNQTEPAELLQPNTFEPHETPKKSKKKQIVLILSITILVFAGVAGYLLILNKNDESMDSPAAKNSPFTSGDGNEKDEQANVPRYLLEKNQTTAGISVGYQKKTSQVQETSGSWLSPVAYAEEIVEYEPVVFYSNNSNIYSLNSVTKETKQVTSESGSNPAFSSTAQKLAFNKANCEVSVLDAASGIEEVIAEGKDLEEGDVNINPENVCYIPISWSPSGNKLALAGNYSLSTTELGLVGFTDIYIFDFSNNTLEKVEPPEEFNTVSSIYGFLWQNEDQILAKYLKRIAFGETESEQFTAVNLVDNSYTKILTNQSIEVDTIQYVGGAVYVLGSDPRQLYYSPSGDLNDLNAIDDIEGWGVTYLLKADSASSQAERVYFSDQVEKVNDGIFDAYTIFSKQQPNGESERLYTMESYGARLLGWGLNYDEIVYIAVLSGESELHKYTISTNTNEVLVPNLPLQ